MTIVDTTVWIDYFGDRVNPETEWLHRALAWQAVALTDLILCEVLQGVRDDLQFQQFRFELSRLRVFRGSPHLAVASAQNYRTLRARGITIRKTIDCLIATFCMEGNHSLLHSDRDFDHFERQLGLHVIHP